MKLLREPLVHFVLIGALLFALHGWFGAAEAPTPADPGLRVEVSLAAMQPRWADWEQQWGVPPSADERAAVVREYVREELLVREARRLGLTADESGVRRQLAARMEFLSRDGGLIPEPTDVQLQARLQSDPARYGPPPRITFSHIVFAIERRGAAAAADATAALAKLRAMAPAPERAPEFGDPFTLRHDYALTSQREIELLFGLEFAGAVWALPLGAWAGPVTSPFGAHCVRVSERVAGQAPALGAVRDQVRTDWIEAQRTQRFEAFLADLQTRYRITYGAGVPTPPVK